jgi:filamentous hemagglutinin
MPWEDYLAGQMPRIFRLPRDFKTFDFYDSTTRTAISAKTLDTLTTSKLLNPKQVYSSIKTNIDVAADFPGYELGGFQLTPKMIASRELHVAVPAGTTPAQWYEIGKAIQYGHSKGVTVIVTPVR